MKSLPPKNLFILFLTAFIWGTAFVAQSVGMDHIGPFAFNAVRSYVGGIALIPVILFFNSRKTAQQRQTEQEIQHPLTAEDHINDGKEDGNMQARYGDHMANAADLEAAVGFVGKVGAVTQQKGFAKGKCVLGHRIFQQVRDLLPPQGRVIPQSKFLSRLDICISPLVG